MPRFKQLPDGGLKVWLSPADTRSWANRPGARWPCATLFDRRVFAELDAQGDLVDLMVDGDAEAVGHDCSDVDSHELNCLLSDTVLARFGVNHPAAIAVTRLPA